MRSNYLNSVISRRSLSSMLYDHVQVFRRGIMVISHAVLASALIYQVCLTMFYYYWLRSKQFKFIICALVDEFLLFADLVIGCIKIYKSKHISLNIHVRTNILLLKLIYMFLICRKVLQHIIGSFGISSMQNMHCFLGSSEMRNLLYVYDPL